MPNSKQSKKLVLFLREKNGEILPAFAVGARKRAPYPEWAIINRRAASNAAQNNGLSLDSKIVLALIGAAKPLPLKGLAAIVGTPTSSARRTLKRLVDAGLVYQPERGRYCIAPALAWAGSWE